MTSGNNHLIDGLPAITSPAACPDRNEPIAMLPKTRKSLKA